MRCIRSYTLNVKAFRGSFISVVNDYHLWLMTSPEISVVSQSQSTELGGDIVLIVTFKKPGPLIDEQGNTCNEDGTRK